MNTPCNLPYFEIEVDKDGEFVNSSQVNNIVKFLTDSKSRISDLFVISHGWNNDESEARSLYERFFSQFCGTLEKNAASGVSAQQCAVVGILWPSKKFADSSVTPGGAAALDAGPDLMAALDQLAAIAGPAAVPKIQIAKEQVPRLADDPAAQQSFVTSVRSLLPNREDREEGTHNLFKFEGDDLLQQLSTPLILTSQAADTDEGGSAAISMMEASEENGEAQSLSSILQGIKGGAMRLLNYTTYYLMKDRAGKVGAGAVSQTLRMIQTGFPNIHIHLIGHSFGARVVTSAVATIIEPVASVTLLQAAFSHNSFSPDYDNSHKPGAFRDVIDSAKIRGPLLITHSIKDRAVGLAYAVASRIAGQNAAAIGDADDPYGGLGRNGAQHTLEATDGELLPPGARYLFVPGKIANLKADTTILDHSDIVKAQTAYALLAAAGLARPT